jgi:hypothetical protein
MTKVRIDGFSRENKHLPAKREDYLDVRLPDCWPYASWLAERTGSA